MQPPPLPGHRKSGASTGAIVGIIAAVVVVVLVLGVGGFIALKGFLDFQKGAGTVITEPKIATTPTPPAPAAETSESATDSSTASDSGSADAGASSSSSADDGVVTDAEARAVVKKFLDFRVAHNIAASKTLCTKNMLTGENGSFVNDKYWRPDSYKITKTTPDQMYIHVTTMGMWPSGEEPTIYSVWRDPASRQGAHRRDARSGDQPRPRQVAKARALAAARDLTKEDPDDRGLNHRGLVRGRKEGASEWKGGPYSWAQLCAYAAEGRIAAEDLVWHESLPDWVPAGSIPGLMPRRGRCRAIRHWPATASAPCRRTALRSPHRARLRAGSAARPRLRVARKGRGSAVGLSIAASCWCLPPMAGRVLGVVERHARREAEWRAQPWRRRGHGARPRQARADDGVRGGARQPDRRRAQGRCRTRRCREAVAKSLGGIGRRRDRLHQRVPDPVPRHQRGPS